MSTPRRPAPIPLAAPSPLRVSLLSGLIGALFGSVISAAVNYLVVGVPDSASVNALNHGISGLFSGFAAGFIGLMVHLRKGTGEPVGVPPEETTATAQQG
ncbi:hypothetical protein ACFWFI_34835 [Streptomyces sp. NPDC060209]|uniref:hypothetical protein n=1 Tax=Streptomyces sp. NPDC060209 TaxID=3347073 RepID=UPI003667817B